MFVPLGFVFVLALLPPSLCNEIEEEKSPDLGELFGAFSKLMGGVEGEEGCKYKCPNGQLPTKKKGHVPKSNGCGSQGISVDTSKFPGLGKCCDTHDYCYDTCGRERRACDDAFQTCMDSHCDTLEKTKKDECRNLSGVMSAGASGFGCQAYLDAQANACDCTGKKGDL
eukprot:m.7414 g.7414  ORF g.7414 m.7414 type:complete len:169 (+) comp18623_c0_seq1:25-531(+)